MISPESLKAVEVMAVEMAKKGVRLAPLGDTPLQMLFEACAKDHVTSQGELPKPPDLLTRSQRLTLDGVDQHEVYLEEFAERVSQSVGTMVAIARNQINPMVTELMGRIDEAMKLTAKTQLPFQIQMIFRHAIFKNSAMDELTRRYQKGEPEPPVLRGLDWPEMSLAELKKGLVSHVGRVDQDLMTFLKTCGDDQIQACYKVTFQQEPSPCVLDPAEQALLIFFWCENWLNDIPEQVLGSLSEIQALLTKMKSYQGRILQRAIEDYARSIKYRQIVLYAPSVRTRSEPIRVLGENYNDWLKEGGSPELLMGSVLLGEKVSFAMAPERREAAMKAYYKDVRLQDYERNSLLRIKVMEAVRSYVMAEIETCATEVQPDARRDYFAFLKQRPYHTHIDLGPWVRELLASVFFTGSRALNILQSMDEIMAQQPDMEAREAATFAAIDLVVLYLAGMMEARYV